MEKNVEITFIDIERAINLSDWQRNLGNKRTKAGKFYWQFALIYLQYCQRAGQPADFEILTRNYWDIFYRPHEFFIWLLSHFDGVSRGSISKADFNGLIDYCMAIFKSHQIHLEDKLRFWFKKNPRDFSVIEPEQLTILELDFLDHRHPHLPTISECYASMLDAANYKTHENFTVIGYPGLKPSQVHDFNEAMDELIKAEYMYHFAEYLSEFTYTSFDTFFSKIPVNGPAEALQKTLELQPEVVNWSDARLKYQICLKYYLHDANELNPDSVQSAIRNFKTQKM